MKGISKVIVVHRGEGVNDEMKQLFWKWFGSSVLIKPVHYAALIEEFEFKGQAQLVVCRESVVDHGRLIVSQWPYETHFLFLGKEGKDDEHIHFAKELRLWNHKILHLA